ncbi:hypothetical protein, partial [Streptomyces fildesensis]|uniref:hypothetical protein n=1 Tax=Streptomyces fildesensis TaxID=375757 RepID=UPI001E3EAA56
MNAIHAAQKAPAVALAVASELHRSGMKETACGLAKTMYTRVEPVAKGFYTAYEPRAEQYMLSAWRKLNQIPLFPTVSRAVLPTAAYCCDKYNQTVITSADKGCKVMAYLPLVPTEKIAK